MYYQRFDVKATILNFAKNGPCNSIRECAIYNSKFKSVQRYFGENGSRQPIRLNASNFDQILQRDALAFYCSYWYYDSKDFTNPVGRDLVWTIRAKHGGIRIAKFITRLVLDALGEVGIEPQLKYSGDLGFDIIIPLEVIPHEVWMGNLEALDEIHRELTGHIVSYVREHLPEAEVLSTRGLAVIKIDQDVCLLSELRVRRGLLLAPMSLNPETNFVSVPIDPNQLESFSVVEATRENARSRSRTSPTLNPSFLKLIRLHQPIVGVEQAMSPT